MREIVDKLFPPLSGIVDEMSVDIYKRYLTCIAILPELPVEQQRVFLPFGKSGDKRVGQLSFPAFELRTSKVTGGDHIKYMNIISLIPQLPHILGVPFRGSPDKRFDRSSRADMLVFDMDANINFTEAKDQVFVHQGREDLLDSSVVVCKLVGGFAIESVTAMIES